MVFSRLLKSVCLSSVTGQKNHKEKNHFRQCTLKLTNHRKHAAFFNQSDPKPKRRDLQVVYTRFPPPLMLTAR